MEFAEMDQRRRDFEREKEEFEERVKLWETKSVPEKTKKPKNKSLF